MLLRMALFFLNYPVRISQKSCRATNEDGTIALTYEQESGEKGIVTLKGSKGSYQFVSNKEA